LGSTLEKQTNPFLKWLIFFTGIDDDLNDMHTYETWTQAYDLDLQRQRCKNLQGNL
jgi:hypothetical protein